jgi:dihydroorotate dehydrogenase electron transfer subunit
MRTSRHPSAKRIRPQPGAERDPVRMPYPFRPEFPPSAVSELILSFTSENDVILDPLSAFGAVGIEALRLNRRAALMEWNPATAFLAEALLRPVSLPRLQWAFEEVRAACRESISELFSTACPKCGGRGVIDSLFRESGSIVRIEYSCACSRKRLTKRPDAGDLRAEERIAGREIPFWHPPGVLPISENGAACDRPSDLPGRRTIIALSAILDAVENLERSPAADLAKAAFAATLEACYLPALPSPPKPAPKRHFPAGCPEANPWNAFETAFHQLYKSKKAAAQIQTSAAIGRNFTALLSGRANVVFLDRYAADAPSGGLPDGSVDCAITAVPYVSGGRGATLASIQAAWLRMELDPGRDYGLESEREGSLRRRNERLLAAFRTIRRAGKKKSNALIFCAEDGSILHGLLNLTEQSGLVAERVSRLPPADGFGVPGGYTIQARIHKLEPAPPARISADDLLNKLADAAQIRFAVHGVQTTSGNILDAFYRRLNRDELAAVSKYSIDDLLAKAVERFARFRNGKITFPAGRSRRGAAKRIPAHWRRIVLDAEALAAGNADNAEGARRTAEKRLAREGLTEEDVRALRKELRPAEVDLRRRERTAGLLRDLGKALGYPTSRESKKTACLVHWKTDTGRTIDFSLGGNDILAASRLRNKVIAEWGTMSYLELERRLWEWHRRHPDAGQDFSGKLVPLEDLPSAEETGRRNGPAPARNLKLKVVRNRSVCAGHYLMTLQLPKGTELPFTPGQFLHLTCDPDRSGRPYPLTLRRPFSIHRAQYPGFDRRALAWIDDLPAEIRCALARRPSRIDVLYRVVGEGTEILSRIPEGAILDGIGPCGNGFAVGEERTAVIVAGGIGIAPLAALAEELRRCGKDVRIYLGAVEIGMLRLAATAGAGETDDERKLTAAIESEFREIGAQILTVCTDDGSAGEKGLVTEMFERGIRDGCVPREDVCVYACGPEGMLRAAAGIAERYNLPCQVSLEERMACGIGACYSCTATVRNPDGTTRKARVCREGPVFQARDIVWKV